MTRISAAERIFRGAIPAAPSVVAVGGGPEDVADTSLGETSNFLLSVASGSDLQEYSVRPARAEGVAPSTGTRAHEVVIATDRAGATPVAHDTTSARVDEALVMISPRPCVGRVGPHHREQVGGPPDTGVGGRAATINEWPRSVRGRSGAAGRRRFRRRATDRGSRRGGKCRSGTSGMSSRNDLHNLGGHLRPGASVKKTIRRVDGRAPRAFVPTQLPSRAPVHAAHRSFGVRIVPGHHRGARRCRPFIVARGMVFRGANAYDS